MRQNNSNKPCDSSENSSKNIDSTMSTKRYNNGCDIGKAHSSIKPCEPMVFKLVEFHEQNQHRPYLSKIMESFFSFLSLFSLYPCGPKKTGHLQLCSQQKPTESGHLQFCSKNEKKRKSHIHNFAIEERNHQQQTKQNKWDKQYHSSWCSLATRPEKAGRTGNGGNDLRSESENKEQKKRHITST
jgi:hypothetical protein